MHIRIRKLNTLSKEEDVFVDISKTASIEELEKLIRKKVKISSESLKLYYQGKELNGAHRITDYGIRLNDVVQLLIKGNDGEDKTAVAIENLNVPKGQGKTSQFVGAESKYYKINDLIDVIDEDHGAWFEAKIVEILRKSDENIEREDDLIFKIRMDSREEITAPFNVKFKHIRPRAYYTYKMSELEEDMTVLANYNIEKPKELGFWYDFKIKKINRTKREIKGVLLVGRVCTYLEDCNIKLVDEVMRIEEPKLLSQKSDINTTTVVKIAPRKLPPFCDKCKDNQRKKCKHCGCFKCFQKTEPSTLLECDECGNFYHLACLSPALAKIPEGDWYCPDCKTDENEIVKAGEKLKASKKRMKMASNQCKQEKNMSIRDWGQGMACVGRTVECTIVPKDHYGPVPGIEVGTCWKFRMQVSEAGIHRPHVAGIHGRENDGAYSLVLSGGYEDDIDNGEEFYYTGSGGRDLSGNKRVSEQSCDQKLTRMNKALAMNCNAKFNEKLGSEATDWRNGKPVRVVRNYKLAAHSKYAPKDGNRYDGIYKVVKYYPERGKSGFIVWRYLLRRDDPVPAPWQKGGQEFDMIYPPGYLEARNKGDVQHDENKVGIITKGKKRKKISSDAQGRILNFLQTPPSKKQKIPSYKIDSEIANFIKQDSPNKKLWDECKEITKEGKMKFINKVEEMFLCICCLEVVFEPITTTCKHNVCKGCLKRSFSSKIFVCPYCRFELGENYEMNVNENLRQALKMLFPGYESGR